MSSTSDDVIEIGKNLSPGSRLQSAREALGISQKSLADDLYLPRNYILWIEEGAYEKLPSMVFCKGYIRAYAKAVNENGEELIELLNQGKENLSNKAPLMSVSKIDEQVKVGDPVMKWSTLLFVLVLGAVVFWWWKTQYGLNAPFLASQDPIAVETVDGNELVLPSLDNQNASVETSNAQLSVDPQSMAATSSVSQSGQVAIVSSSVVSDQSITVNNGTGIALQLNVSDESTQADAQLAQLEQVVKTLEPEPVDTLSASENTDETPVTVDISLLQVSFSNDCWVTIKDARGKTLFNGIKKSGQKISLSGDAPLSLSIGRVNSVSKITYGGKVVDLKALSRNNIANFKLPL